MRTANCVGAHGVIIPKEIQWVLTVLSQKLRQVRLNIHLLQRLQISLTIDSLKDEGLWIAAADMDGQEMYDIDLKGSLGLVIGSEGEGINRLVRENATS